MNEAVQAVLDDPSASPGYDELLKLSRALFEGERDFIANAANLSSLLYHSLGNVNWCGFYLLRAGQLVLGPFQGKVACVRIAMGEGVCGVSASSRRTVIVPDVGAFPGHIACDAASRSEIVVPLVVGGRLIGVLDIDSPVVGRFDENDGAGLERIARALLEASEAPRLD